MDEPRNPTPRDGDALERRERRRDTAASAEEARRPGLEALVTSVSTELTVLDVGRLDAAMGLALQRVGEAIEVDQAWLCRTASDGRHARLMHEWCTAGSSVFELVQGVDRADCPWFADRLRAHETIFVSVGGELPPRAAATRRLLAELNLGALLAIPLASGARLRGYAAFGSRRRSLGCSPDDLALLRFVGDVLADGLERLDEEARRRAGAVQPAGIVDLLRAQREILERIAAGTDRTRTLDGLCALADRYIPRMRSSLWSLDPLGESLRCVGGDLPAELKAAVEELDPGLDVGPFGLSCAGDRAVIDDVMRDPSFQSYHHEALAGGVRSCWTEPVRAATGRVVGVLALVGGEIATPSPSEQELVADVARMAGLALERFGDAPRPDAATPVRPEAERLEALMRQARKMQALGLQAGSVVRDFNNVFTAILGNTELLLDVKRDATTETSPRDRTGDETVLVCEPDPMVRELASTVLDLHGYTVLATADAAAAQRLAAAHEGPIHLLFADALLSSGRPRGISGRELAHELGRRVPGLRVLLSSAYPTDSFDRLARGPRGADLLEKPFSAGELLDRVRQILDAE